MNEEHDSGLPRGAGGSEGEGGHGGGTAVAHIIVDKKPKEVRAGDWIVQELKLAVGVDPAKVLAEVEPSGLKDLEDNAHIIVRDGQRFMSHARTGGSS